MAGSENVKPVVKVGDQVRSKYSCHSGGYDIGDVFTVTKVDGEFIGFFDNHGDNRLRADDEFDLLPVAEATGKPAFKVGDRVRLIKDGLSTTGAVGKLATIKSWSGGKIVDNGQYLLNIDGPVDYETLAITPQYTRASPECFELLAPPLTIETGKFYRIRGGRKVGPMDEWISDQFRERAGDGRYWTVDGVGHNETKGEDLIAEWVDEPAGNDSQPVAEQQAGTVFIDVSKAGPSQLHLAKGRLVKINQGYGFELARYGDYVWVDTGKKQPVVAHINEIKEAA